MGEMLLKSGVSEMEKMGMLNEDEWIEERGRNASQNEAWNCL
jgi:hypothetical protein